MRAESANEPAPIIAIVPAAGRSTRMGRPKQLIDFDGRTILHAVIDPLRSTCRDTIVVLPPALRGRVTTDGLHVIENDDPRSDMIDSIRRALAYAADSLPPAPGWLVVPGDLPGLTPDLVRRCIDVFLEDPSSIVVAAHDGRHGHPIIVPASMTGDVHATACNKGLRALKTTHADRLRLVDFGAPTVLRNLNTPADLSAAVRGDAGAPG